MGKFLIAATALTLVGATSGAMAGESRHRDRIADKVSSGIQQELEGMGYRVLRVEAEHGLYEFRVVNDTGIPVDALFDAVTGELIQAKLH